MKRMNVVNEYGERIGFLYCGDYGRTKYKTTLYRNKIVCYWENSENAMRYLRKLGLQVVG